MVRKRRPAKQPNKRRQQIKKQSLATVAAFVKGLKVAAQYGIDIEAVGRLIRKQTARQKMQAGKAGKPSHGQQKNYGHQMRPARIPMFKGFL